MGRIFTSFSFIPLIFILVRAVSGQSCTPPTAYALNVPLRAQETDVWCWAASEQMVMEFLGTPAPQCEQADKYLSVSNCCKKPIPGECVTTGWPVFSLYNFAYDETNNTALTFDQLKEQIFCKKKPVAYSWHWYGGGGHVMVARGYYTADGVNYLNINDPWPPPGYDSSLPNGGEQYDITYSNFVKGSNHYHWDDFYNVTKR